MTVKPSKNINTDKNQKLPKPIPKLILRPTLKTIRLRKWIKKQTKQNRTIIKNLAVNGPFNDSFSILVKTYVPPHPKLTNLTAWGKRETIIKDLDRRYDKKGHN